MKGRVKRAFCISYKKLLSHIGQTVRRNVIHMIQITGKEEKLLCEKEQLVCLTLKAFPSFQCFYNFEPDNQSRSRR